jgi:alpha-tubulin suppressor-like RCC1 family protein
VTAAGLSPASAGAARRTLRAWGLGGDGELGNGHRKNVQLTPVRVRLPRGVRVTSVRAGCDDAVALNSRGRANAWGDNRTGDLGDGSRTSADRPVRVRLPTGTNVKAIRAGCRHNVALTTKGRVLAWGFNDEGQLGIGSHHNRLRPARVKFPGHPRIKIIAAGCDHSLAVSTGGQLYGWGRNTDGELGDGSTTERDTPERVGLDGPIDTGQLTRAAARARIVSLFGGNRHTLALLSSGILLAWGENAAGQLGDGMPDGSDVPVTVALPAGATVKAIGASEFNSMALTASGHALAWGDNSFGELGNGVPGNSNVPVRVALPAGLRATGIGTGPGSETPFAITRKS